MKAFLKFGGFLVSLPVSWLIARWWDMLSGDPWCLHYFPKWADASLHFIIKPLLSNDIGIAAEQMDFMEVWILTFIMTSAVAVAGFALIKKHLFDGSEAGGVILERSIANEEESIGN
jgi:hypothetical protein